MGLGGDFFERLELRDTTGGRLELEQQWEVGLFYFSLRRTMRWS